MIRDVRHRRLEEGMPPIVRSALPIVWDDPCRPSFRFSTLLVLRSRTARALSALGLVMHFAVMAMDHPAASVRETWWLGLGDSACTALLMAEVAAGLWALGPRRFMQADVHRPGPLEAVAAISCGLSMALGRWPPSWLTSLTDSTEARVPSAGDAAMRARRVLRCMRVLCVPVAVTSMYRQMGVSIMQLWKAAPAIAPIMMLRMVVLYMLGILGVQIFGGMCVQGNLEDEESLRCQLTRNQLEAHSHFAHIGFSLRSLFVYGMGRGWVELLKNTTIEASARPPRPLGYMPEVISLVQAATALRNVSKSGAAARAEGLITMARDLLGGCVSDNEMQMLGKAGLVDCKIKEGLLCENTCGSEWAKMLLPSFIVVNKFIMLYLIVAVLVEEVDWTYEPLSGNVRPGLSRRKVHRIYHLWRRSVRLRSRLHLQPTRDPLTKDEAAQVRSKLIHEAIRVGYLRVHAARAAAAAAAAAALGLGVESHEALPSTGNHGGSKGDAASGPRGGTQGPSAGQISAEVGEGLAPRLEGNKGPEALAAAVRSWVSPFLRAELVTLAAPAPQDVRNSAEARGSVGHARAGERMSSQSHRQAGTANISEHSSDQEASSSVYTSTSPSPSPTRADDLGREPEDAVEPADVQAVYVERPVAPGTTALEESGSRNGGGGGVGRVGGPRPGPGSRLAVSAVSVAEKSLDEVASLDKDAATERQYGGGVGARRRGEIHEWHTKRVRGRQERSQQGGLLQAAAPSRLVSLIQTRFPRPPRLQQGDSSAGFAGRESAAGHGTQHLTPAASGGGQRSRPLHKAVSFETPPEHHDIAYPRKDTKAAARAKDPGRQNQRAGWTDKRKETDSFVDSKSIGQVDQALLEVPRIRQDSLLETVYSDARFASGVRELLPSGSRGRQLQRGLKGGLVQSNAVVRGPAGRLETFNATSAAGIGELQGLQRQPFSHVPLGGVVGPAAAGTWSQDSRQEGARSGHIVREGAAPSGAGSLRSRHPGAVRAPLLQPIRDAETDTSLRPGANPATGHTPVPAPGSAGLQRDRALSQWKELPAHPSAAAELSSAADGGELRGTKSAVKVHVHADGARPGAEVAEGHERGMQSLTPAGQIGRAIREATELEPVVTGQRRPWRRRHS